MRDPMGGLDGDGFSDALEDGQSGCGFGLDSSLQWADLVTGAMLHDGLADGTCVDPNEGEPSGASLWDRLGRPGGQGHTQLSPPYIEEQVRYLRAQLEG